MRKTCALLASLTLLPGCEIAGLATDPCATLRPVIVSRSDVLTPETARQILAHNEAWARLCR